MDWNEISVADVFGGIDVYLFDQIQRNRFKRGMRILDAGCGNGRNLAFFLRAGYDVYGVDQDPMAIRAVKRLAKRVGYGNAIERFQVAMLTNLPFDDGSFDAVVCNAVLHFAGDDKEFDDHLQELWRVLAPGGFLFARLASKIGIDHLVKSLGGRRFGLPDGTERFLVDEEFLLEKTEVLNGTLLDPLKTVNVQNARCMTTWVVGKHQP